MKTGVNLTIARLSLFFSTCHRIQHFFVDREKQKLVPATIKRRNRRSRCRLPLSLALALAFNLPSAVYADNDLTTVGAERAGNADGSIPPWEGGINQPPNGYQTGQHHPDPFSGDASLFTIDHANAAEYGDKLTAGHKALLTKYPSTYKLLVYPSRRSASHPQWVLDQTRQFAQARITDNGAGVEGVLAGIPFPQPDNGQQAIWNSLLSYKGGGIRRYVNSATVNDDGDYVLNVARQEIEYPHQLENMTEDKIDNILSRGITIVEAPPKIAGTLALFHVQLNSKDSERKTWAYARGKRRVMRAPTLTSDSPMSVSEGVHLLDQAGMFNGPITRFDWQLLGKKELYIPYNAYKLHSDATAIETIIQSGHVNPELSRYELHRVWVVEAKRKADTKHIHQRRVYYLDEDSWRIVLAEHYDDAGKLDRFSESHHINYYEVPVFLSTLDVYYKLDQDKYFVSGLDNQHPVNDFSFREKPGYYTPNNLKRKAVR